MQKLNAPSRSLTPLKPGGTLIAVIEMSLSSWLVAGIVPGIERQPLKKLEVDESTLLKLLIRWMSSQLNRRSFGKALGTAYIARHQKAEIASILMSASGRGNAMSL